MKSKKLLITMIIISILFITTLVLSIRKVREEKKIEVSNVETETAIDEVAEELADNETADLGEMEEDMVQEFPIEHTVKLSSNLSPDSPFQQLLATGNVKITSITKAGYKYVTLDSVRSIIPEFKGETYNELKEKFDSLKLEICVKDEFSITEDSKILSEQKVWFYIYPERSMLIYSEDGHEKGISFGEYILYKNGEDIIFEGIDYYERIYYKLVSEGDGKLHISEKYNVDVPNESIIVHTSKDFTVTLEGKYLKIWQYRKVVYQTEIPKPANENEELFGNTYPQKKLGTYYGTGKPYVDEDGNLIQLKIAPGSTELNVEYLVLASDVAEIISDQFGRAFAFKDKSGNYFAELLDEDDFGKEAVKLCQENISTLTFEIEKSNSDKLESLWLRVWLKKQETAVYIEVYTPSNPVPIYKLVDSIANKTYYDVSECENSYNEIVAEMQQLEK